MSIASIALQRLSQQRLTHNPFGAPAEVVSWLGAVQAQDYPGAKWSLGMRMAGATDETIERAFNDGEILRTHLMRPTWHFVTPADIRWIQELTAPRVNAVNAHRYRELELDEALLRRCSDLIARALESGNQLTRVELREALEREGILTEGQRLAYILHRAELDLVACSGPRRGKQFTYMLLDERAPRAMSLPREEALAELTRRYFTGHGPATAKDFAWWSGLTMADVKTGLEIAAPHLSSESVDGQVMYFSAAVSPAPGADPAAGKPDPGKPPAACLLPLYDEYHVGYANFGRSILYRREGRLSAEFNATILYNQRVIGFWQRTFRKGGVTVALSPLAQFSAGEKEAVGSAVETYAEFLGLPADCVWLEESR
jgi:hypothetical protein